MTGQPVLRTSRLLLRRWKPSDRGPFAALNADPEVTRYLPAPLTRAESDALVDRIEADFDEHGFGLWAIEPDGNGAFVGFVGLSVPQFEAHFTPAVEVGWRLARDAWRRGFATEGATAALDFAFARAGLDEVVSFTVPANSASRAVMARLGMSHDPGDDFDHPGLPLDSELRRHVLYRIRRPTKAAPAPTLP